MGGCSWGNKEQEEQPKERIENELELARRFLPSLATVSMDGSTSPQKGFSRLVDIEDFFIAPLFHSLFLSWLLEAFEGGGVEL